MSIDTVVAEYKKMANNARLFDRRNEFIAVMLEAEAARFEALKQRKAVVIANNGEKVELGTEAAAYALARRIISKIDPDFSGEVECYQIGEPGYDPNIGVFANWNKYPKWARTIEKLERLGCPISAEWSDEWVDCHECGKAYRSQPDSYGWTKSWWLGPYDCEIICANCTKEYGTEDYPEYLSEHHDHADTFLDDRDLEDAGWKQLDYTFENGLYGGQSASPAKIAAWLRKQSVEKFLFKIDTVGQFDMDFTVWVPDEADIDEHYFKTDADWGRMNGPDPAEMAKKALKSVPPMPVSEVGKVQYVKVNTHDGTADVRYLTQDEFIEGVQ